MDHGTLTERVERIEGIMGIAYGGPEIEEQGSEDKTTRVTAFEEIIHKIQSSTEKVSASAGRLEDIGTRIMGALPQEGSGAGHEQKPDGTLDHALLALDWLDGSIARLQAAVLRLERL